MDPESFRYDRQTTDKHGQSDKGDAADCVPKNLSLHNLFIGVHALLTVLAEQNNVTGCTEFHENLPHYGIQCDHWITCGVVYG